jgi:hypothetical protein
VRAVHSLGLLIVALGAAASASAAIDLDAVAAWDGWSRPGRATELRLSLVSDQPDLVELEIAAGDQRITTTTELEPGLPRRIDLPVPTAERFEIVAKARSGAKREIETTLALSESPLVARVGATLPTTFEAFHVLALEPSAIPREAAAFTSVDALIIDLASVSALDDRQMAALLDHVARCEPTVLVGASVAEAGVFEGAVGCGAAKFAAVATPEEAAAALQTLLSSTARPVPDQRVLGSLDGPNLSSWNVVLALLAAASVAILLTALFTSSLFAALAVPAVSAIALLWIVQSHGVGSTLLVWSETGSGERVAQYAALQQNAVTRRGTARVPIASALSQPRLCRKEPASRWTWNIENDRYTGVELEERLFGNVALCYAGHFPLSRSAEIDVTSPERLAIGNKGSSDWPAGAVAWNGSLHRVGAVAAGQSVALNAVDGDVATDAVEREALARTPYDGVSLLWPLDLSGTEQLPARAQAWVLMHARRGDGTT